MFFFYLDLFEFFIHHFLGRDLHGEKNRSLVLEDLIDYYILKKRLKKRDLRGQRPQKLHNKAKVLKKRLEAVTKRLNQILEKLNKPGGIKKFF